MLRVREDVIVPHAMLWPDETRDPGELLPPSTEVSDEEIAGALEAIGEEKPLPETPEPKIGPPPRSRCPRPPRSGPTASTGAPAPTVVAGEETHCQTIGNGTPIRVLTTSHNP
ncbi:hypothetical protein ABZ464_36975 [Streptomyces sp. NPDC005820]|uniref:hypothetical protein n=1 Tax=Streptomyces sp. NPDC005820 TaxID=3157069 RepID=UPI0034087853